MGILLDDKVLKQKKLGQELNLKVTINNASDRIFVEFSSNDGKLVLQRNFQDSIVGQRDAEKFQTSIKSINDLKKYFKRKKEK